MAKRLPPSKRSGRGDFDSATARARGMTRGPSGHLPSRDPVTGKILKRISHPTFNKAIAADAKLGFKPFRNVKSGAIHTFKRNPNTKLFKREDAAALISRSRKLRKPQR